MYYAGKWDIDHSIDWQRRGTKQDIAYASIGFVLRTEMESSAKGNKCFGKNSSREIVQLQEVYWRVSWYNYGGHKDYLNPNRDSP